MQDLINKAQSYLNGDLDYTDGISVFIQLTKNKQLIKFLTGPYSAAREQKLRYELSKITKHNGKETSTNALGSRKSEPIAVNEANSLSFKKSSSKTEYRSVHSNTHSDTSGDSADLSVISKLEAERREQYRQRGHEHGRLHETISDANRKEIALRILDIQSNIDQLNRELKDARNGKIPSRFVKQSISADQYIQIRNLKYYIARHKRELEKAESISRKEKLQQLIDQNQQKLNQLL